MIRSFRFTRFGTIRCRLIALCFSALLAVGLAGCGSGSNTNAADDDGELIVSLTDAAGDFLVYSVDVTSISLKKANGAVVETLPLTTTVDFTQYVDLTEFLTATTVPSGNYTQATLTLDYSTAIIEVEGKDGEPLPVNQILDADGNTVSLLDVSVQLENHSSLVIAPGIPSLLALDFDLQSSHVVDLDNPAGPTITVEPVLIADIDAETPRVHRVRGPLHQVDITDQSYQVVIRPFHHTLSNDERFGQLTVITDNETVFEINGEGYTGLDGLTALETLPAFSATIAKGALRFEPLRFVAHEVYAGSSVPGGDQDVVTGSVVARSGDEVTVKGVTLIRSDGRVVFRDTVTVTLAESTMVKKQLSADNHSIGDISVGQRVRVFGELTDSEPEFLTIDATNGLVRMLLTTARGTVTDNDPVGGQLTLDLTTLNQHRVDLFDFSGTGVDGDKNADPGAYEIDTDTLNLSGFPAPTATVAKGFVTPFGTAPADFTAQTLVDVSALRAILTTTWAEGSNMPFLNLSDTLLALNTDGVGRFHFISQGGVLIDVTELDEPLEIVPDEQTDGGYLIVQHGGAVELLSTFAAFSQTLQTRLTDGALVDRLIVPGRYDDSAGQLATHRITVHLH